MLCRADVRLNDMNQQAVNNKTQATDLNPISTLVDRLKSQAKYAHDKQDIHNAELDESYLRGYYFGQLVAPEKTAII